MLKNIWWFKCSEMDSWSWTIYCPMNCSNGGKCAWVRGWHTPKLLDGLNCESKGETPEEWVKTHSLARST
jgi:hypothetical protein